MSRWFRWYEGTSEDGKFRHVARMSRVTVRDTIALWAFMLEDAANLAHRGVCKRNEDFMASNLDFEDGVVERILSAMQSADMISVGHGGITICNWDKRQFEGDTDPTATERQRRHRNKNKTVTNAPVTRDSRPPDTDTDTDTEKKKETREIALCDGWPPDFENLFWKHWPNPVGKKPALKALAAARKRGADFDAIMNGLENYIRDKPPDRQWLNPATFLNQNRWEDQPATVSATNGSAKNQSGGSILAALDRELAKVQLEENADPAAPAYPVLRISN